MKHATLRATSLSTDALKLIRMQRKTNILELEMEKEWRNESKGNEAEFPPSDVNHCVVCTFLSVADLSACLISSLATNETG